MGNDDDPGEDSSARGPTSLAFSNTTRLKANLSPVNLALFSSSRVIPDINTVLIGEPKFRPDLKRLQQREIAQLLCFP
jgi:hypothetical protein